MTDTETRVVEQLDNVLDPCSCMVDEPVSIVDLGLVEDVEVDGTAVSIELLPTTPMCMYMTQIIDEAVMEVEKLGDVESVAVEQNVEDMWRPDRMSEELRDARERRLGPELRNEPEPS